MVTNGSGSASESGPDSQPGWSPQPPPPPPPLDQVLLVTDKPWDPDALPPRPWIAPPHLMRGQITLPHGPGGVGKSQLIAAWTCSLALGKQFGRLRPAKRCKVLLANFEDDEIEVKRLLSAALKYFPGATPTDLEGYVHRVSVGKDIDETMFDLNLRFNSVDTTRTFEAFEYRCEELEPDISIIDTLIAVNAVPEDSNPLMRRVMRALRKSCQQFDMAMILAHHDRKSGLDDSEDGDTNNARGAGDITNAGRFEMAVKKMTSAEAKRFGLNPRDRTSYFRLGSLSSKRNYAAADEAEWFERVTHVIGKEAVAAAIPWTPPDAFQDLTTVIINAILDDIDAGLPNGVRYSDANAAKDRAAWKVTAKHQPGKKEEEAKRIINTWVKNGVLISKEYWNSDNRKDEMGLYVDPAKRPG